MYSHLNANPAARMTTDVLLAFSGLINTEKSFVDLVLKSHRHCYAVM